jgi:hypothetical protein
MPLPPKRKRPKLKKINVSAKSQWRQILKDVEKDAIPIDLLLAITVNLIDGTKIEIDVKSLLADGNDPKLVEQTLDAKFKSIEDYIEDIDFFVSIETVANRVQPITDEMLKDL